jgi:hypothetical protein
MFCLGIIDSYLEMFSGHSYGNYFNPAKSCSHVVDNVPSAKSGIYWIQTKKGPMKVGDHKYFVFIFLQTKCK